MELPVFDAYRHSLSLDGDFKMDPELQTAAKQFFQKIAKRFHQHKVCLSTAAVALSSRVSCRLLGGRRAVANSHFILTEIDFCRGTRAKNGLLHMAEAKGPWPLIV